MSYLVKNDKNEFRVLSIDDIFMWIQNNPENTYYKKTENDS